MAEQENQGQDCTTCFKYKKSVESEMKPENIEDFLEDKWLAERGVGYQVVVTEKQQEKKMSESCIK